MCVCVCVCVNKKTHRGGGEDPTSVGRPHPHLGSGMLEVYKYDCLFVRLIKVLYVCVSRRVIKTVWYECV